MNTLRRSVLLALFTLVLAATATYADSRRSNECVIDGVPSGWYIVPDASFAAAIIEGGAKPVFEGFQILSDAGDFGDTFVVFDLPRFKEPVLFGKLRIYVKDALVGCDCLPELKVKLWDITDLPLLQQPLWTEEEYAAAKKDVSSGRAYGDLSLPTPGSLNVIDRIFEVPLSYDAMYDINAAAGGKLAIATAAGEGWTGEGEQVTFLGPEDGGVVQLVIPNCRAKRTQ